MATTRPAPPWVAELRVVLVHPDGHRVPGHIAIGQPYTLAGGDPAASYESHCPIEIDGLHSPKHPVIAGGTLRALLSGIELAAATLQSFVAYGGRVLDPEDGTDVSLEILFGPLLRNAR